VRDPCGEAGHRAPHAPQAFTSVAKSTHAWAHATRPAVHATAQRPASHTSPSGHATPQSPQWRASCAVSASHPSDASRLQSARPGSQRSTAQAPSRQAAVPSATTHGAHEPIAQPKRGSSLDTHWSSQAFAPAGHEAGDDAAASAGAWGAVQLATAMAATSRRATARLTAEP
jgi:hypothetical protein